MVVGFNHNFRYKGVVYHVQTEDGGLKSPNIITLLYRGGNILASKKTSYADILKVDDLEKVVETLMKDQHREMLRRLKDGEFDALLGLEAAGEKATGEPSPASEVGDRPPSRPAAPAAPEAPAPPPKRRPAKKERPAAGASLDEVILSYLEGEADADEE